MKIDKNIKATNKETNEYFLGPEKIQIQKKETN